VEELIRTPKVNFAAIAELYEQDMLSRELRLELASYQRKISDFSTITQVEVPGTLNGVLRDYQKQGLNWLNFLDEFGFGGCLADDMGLGKTIQVIAFMLLQQQQGNKPANLIVVPATLIFNWQAEIEKFGPSLKVHTIYGADRIKTVDLFNAYDVILTSYGTLLNDIRFLKTYRFNYVFLDESQTLKNPSSQRYQSVALLKSRSKIMLTGTPLENNTFDLYGQLSLACPGLLGSKQHFRDQYAMPIDKFKDTRKAQELRQKVNPFILRRTKKQVAKELPEKTEMVIYCEMGDEQRKVYDSYKAEYRNYLLGQEQQDLGRQSLHILKGITVLRQICNSPALLKNDVFYGNSSAKMDVLMEELESKAGQHKILIFSQFVTMLDLIRTELQQRGIRFAYLSGQTKDREGAVQSFNEDKEVPVFLISLKAGGIGLNLTEADYVYLVDPWWNPAVENQAIDRAYRIGQKKNVVAVRLICPNTIEEKILNLQESKRTLVEDLIKTDGNLLKSLSKADLLELFS
jgi:SNF2 family DNA or RNA helicase